MKPPKIIIESLNSGAVKAVIRDKRNVRLTIMQPAFDDEQCITPARSIEIYGVKDLAALKKVVDEAIKSGVDWSE